MTHVTYGLTAKNRDQLRNPTLGSRVWATFTLFIPLLALMIRFMVSVWVRIGLLSTELVLRVGLECRVKLGLGSGK